MSRRTPDNIDDTLEALLDGPDIRGYKPALNAITGSPMATLLLCQILYWWFKQGRQAFYKFSGPCAGARPGDSWQEELGFSRARLKPHAEKSPAGSPVARRGARR